MSAITTIITVVLSALFGSGVGLIFVKSELKKRNAAAAAAEAETREATIKASISEGEGYNRMIELYNTRLTKTAEQLDKALDKADELSRRVRELEEQVNIISETLDKVTNERDMYKSLCDSKDKTLASLEKELELQTEKNVLLAKRTSHTKGVVTKLRNEMKD